MLDLPTVTLACIETRSHELLRRTLVDALSKVRFGEVLILSDKPIMAPNSGNPIRWYKVDDAPTKEGWERQFWIELPKVVTTQHVLFIEWDAGIFDVDCWGDDFLDYDFIGAPWWYKDGMNVGNGGFSLRTSKLMRHIAANQERYPVAQPGDEVLCRAYRRALEAEGFKWAPENLARDFSFECFDPPGGLSFGFHAMRNWPKVLKPQELVERTRLAEQNPYIRGTRMLADLKAAAPWLDFGTSVLAASHAVEKIDTLA